MVWCYMIVTARIRLCQLRECYQGTVQCRGLNTSTVFITIVRMADGQEPTPNQCTSFLNHRSNKTSLQTLSIIARYSDHDTSWFQRVSAYCVVYTYSLPVYIVYRVYINKYHIYICECMVEFCSSAPCFFDHCEGSRPVFI